MLSLAEALFVWSVLGTRASVGVRGRPTFLTGLVASLIQVYFAMFHYSRGLQERLV